MSLRFTNLQTEYSFFVDSFVQATLKKRYDEGRFVVLILRK